MLIASLIAGCGVMSSQLMDEAQPAVPFSRLASRVHAYEGRVVIVGGYVLEVRNRGQTTLLVVLQAPLDSSQEPLNADLSEGRFMVLHDRFLDPEVFTKGRKVTVGGVVQGVTNEMIGDQPYGYLTLASREIFLWEKKDYPPWVNPRYPNPYPYDDSRYEQPYYRP
jgi:outer membrane lipoprotein